MQAKFTQGSILSHICTMTLASTAGLLSLFFVDLVDMYWLSLLGEVELAAAIGYAGSILFFTLALTIGLSIGCSAVVSQSVGKGNKAMTRRLVTHVIVAIACVTMPVAIVVEWLAPHCLTLLGAEARAHEFALSYMRIVLPSMPLMGLAMAAGGVMRALGYAKEAMYLTVLGGIVNAALDPLFIFAFKMGIEGAATATVCARVAMLVYGLWMVAQRYNLLGLPRRAGLVADIARYFQTAIPAVLTNLSTPVSVAFVTATMAQFGDGAVAGNAIISKIQPLAFAGLFALSGAIGPIAGQNLGANNYDRIRETLRSSVLFVGIYCLCACALLFVGVNYLIALFQAQGDAATLIYWFCSGISGMFVFHGITFVTNAMFNNLRLAHYATVFNFSKATIFTVPFVLIGAELGGPVGVMWGLFAGSAIIAMLGLTVAAYKIRRLGVA